METHRGTEKLQPSCTHTLLTQTSLGTGPVQALFGLEWIGGGWKELKP